MNSPVPSPAATARILIFVVAYRAESHIERVFERVPKELFADERVRFLVIDDASDDAGASRIAEWVTSRGIGNVTVLRNPVNQGYGGNQKLGYRWALDAGFDLVILLHGDGQYAPELLPRFIETWERTGADVVLGSRMRSLAAARAGGMPLYKIVGNRVLTRYQNALTGLDLSEYHTGYRAYATRFLRKVPFEINTQDFHFDTEILLQALHVGARIEEFDIPTHYGDEISHVNGLRYGWHVLRATTSYKLHQLGMLCSLKLRDLQRDVHRDRARRFYSAERMAVERVQAAGARRVLEVAPGAGHVARRLVETGVEVVGIGPREPAPGSVSRFVIGDPDRPLAEDAFAYDAVLLLDLLPRLEDPERFLLDLRNQSRALTPDGEGPLVVLAVPNVAFAAVRLNLLLGRFPYAERGILDVRSRRLFTRASLVKMLRDCGYRIERVQSVAVPFEAVLGGRAGRVLGALSSWLARAWGQGFAFQFLVSARPLPGVRQVLGESKRHRLAGGSATPDATEAPARTLAARERR